jgi:hypothetical protein
VRVAYETDPFNYRGKIRARLGAELLANGRPGAGSGRAPDDPVLLMHGGADTLADPAGLAELDGLVRSTDKTVRLYDGLYHEIFQRAGEGRGAGRGGGLAGTRTAARLRPTTGEAFRRRPGQGSPLCLAWASRAVWLSCHAPIGQFRLE